MHRNLVAIVKEYVYKLRIRNVELRIMFENEDDHYKSRDEIKKMPVYKKAWEIRLLADKITEVAGNTDIQVSEIEQSMFEDTISYLRQNAMIIPVKIASAEAVELYDLKMENAAIIRKAARELMTDSTEMKMYGFKDHDYIQLLRDEVEAFRVLFAEWIKTFDEWNYIIDRWGLFNPPGVNYDDHDPDDDIPFNPDDFFE